MIDLHSHILPDLDDGARTLADSLDMARAFAAGGVRSVAATPHVRDDYPTTVAAMEHAVGSLRYEPPRGIELEVLPGAEIALEHLDLLTLDELRRFGLGGNPSYLLVEFPYYGWPLRLSRDVNRLLAEGITPVIAHPERSEDVEEDPERLEAVVRAGALVQITAASLDGRLGRRIKKTALTLIDLELAHLVASDAHHPEIRAAGMAAAAGAVSDDDLARWLTVDVPGAIVGGKTTPNRPVGRETGRGWRR